MKLISRLKIYEPDGTELIEAIVAEGSHRVANKMQDDYVEIKFVSDKNVRIHRGCYCDVPVGEKNIRYVATDDVFPTYNTSNKGYDYSVRLDHWFYNNKRYMLTLLPKYGAVTTSFGYTNTILEHLKLFVEQLVALKQKDSTVYIPGKIAIQYYANGKRYDSLYSVSTLPIVIGSRLVPIAEKVESEIGNINEAASLIEDVVRYVQYDNIDIVSALNSLCDEEAFDCEWWIDDDTLYFGRCEYGDKITLRFHEAFEDMQMTRSSGEYATKLIAFGSTTNIPARYRKFLEFDLTDVENNPVEYSRSTAFTNNINESVVLSASTTNTSTNKMVNLAEFTVTEEQTWISAPFALDVSLADSTHNSNFTFSISRASLMFVFSDGTGAQTVNVAVTSNRVFIENDIKLNCKKGARVTCRLNAIISYRTGGTLQMGIESTAMTVIGKRPCLRFRDSFRKMLPSYFEGSQSADTKHTYSCVLSPLVDNNKEENATGGTMGYAYDANGNYSEMKLTDNLVSGRYEVTTQCDVIKTNIGFDPRLSVKVNLIVISGSKTEKHTVCSFEKGFISLGIESQTMTIYVTEGGTAYLQMEWTGENIEANKNNYPKFTIYGLTATCLNASADTVAYFGSTAVPCTINRFGLNEDSDDARWFYFEGLDVGAFLRSKLNTKFSFYANGNKVNGETDVIISSVPVPYFSDEYGANTMVSSYERRLMLPRTCEGNAIYADKIKNADGSIRQCEVVEMVKVFDDIYPSETFAISKIETYKERISNEDDDKTTYKTEKTRFRFFVDKSVLNFKKQYLIKENLQCQFQDGLLCGMTFDLAFEGDTTVKGDNGEDLQAYVIVPSDNYGTELPNDVICPNVGDSFVLLNYNPKELTNLGFIANAENKLEEKARLCLEKISNDNGTYNMTMLPHYAKGKEMPKIGQRVGIVNDTYFDGERSTRVIGYDIPLDIYYDNPKFVFGESLRYSWRKQIQSKI